MYPAIYMGALDGWEYLLPAVLILLVLVSGAFLFYRFGKKRGKALPSASEPKARPVVSRPTQGSTLTHGLGKTRRDGFVARLGAIFQKKLDPETEAKLEEVLLTADIGVACAHRILDSVKAAMGSAQGEATQQAWLALKSEIEAVVRPVCMRPAPDEPSQGPRVVLVLGVNGAGKTTSIGKLAAMNTAQGKKVMVVAGDTFRAAAVEQLKVWAQRSQSLFFAAREGQDPASVAFDGIKEGIKEGVDLVLVDTAGRLHTSANLLEELKKVRRVSGKACPGAPHETLLVLDATNGQNALSQARIFTQETGVDGIVLTKLDGTAKGGVIIAICETLDIPVRWVGVGEKVEDLRPFDPEEFVEALLAQDQ